MNQRKTWIIWVNVKVWDKRRGKGFMQEVETFKPRATLYLPTLFHLYAGQVHSVTPYK